MSPEHEKPMKKSLSSHKYNLGLKKSFYPLPTLPKYWSPCSVVHGGVSEQCQGFYAPVGFQTGVAPAYTVPGAGLRRG